MGLPQSERLREIQGRGLFVTPAVGCLSDVATGTGDVCMSVSLDHSRQQVLLELVRSVLAGFDLETILHHLLDAAQELTGARHAALGVRDGDRVALELFITLGVDTDARHQTGELPRERGVLGRLIDDPRPVRLAGVGQHPRSYVGRPRVQSFLGVPILVRGETRGILYLTEKDTGPFDQTDEDAVVVLADWAAIAIENARRYRELEQRREELERAVRGLQASQAIAVAVGAETRLDRVLELIVQRGRALVDARSLVIVLRDGAELVLAASAGHADRADGRRVALTRSTTEEFLRHGQPRRVTDIGWLGMAADTLGVADARSALIVPLAYHGQDLGVLAAFDPRSDAPCFSAQDERSLEAFAASAATAVATAQAVAEQRLRDSLASADAERRRWARELHDETLQALGGLRLVLASARRRRNFEVLTEATDQVIEQLEHEIASLRAIITELRPAALDELGLMAAIDALIERHRTISGLEIQCDLSLTRADGREHCFDPELATAIYRLVQESLSNVIKHADANHVGVGVGVADGSACIEISDDGGGFDNAQTAEGFGLAGMRERVVLACGALSVDSGPEGTTVRATLPVRDAGPLPAALSSG